jgi:hypothetical protein
MAITNGYTTLKEYKFRFDITDNDDDSDIESIITAVSRSIDNICWQRFFTTSADETRYYSADFSNWLRLPERIISITTLKTDDDNDRTYENTWTEGTDFDLMPFNAITDGEPFRYIELTPNGNYRFPAGISKGVQIIGKFGWSGAPVVIEEVCLMMANRLMARRNMPMGVSGAAAVGQMRVVVEKMKSDQDIMELLSTFILVV